MRWLLAVLVVVVPAPAAIPAVPSTPQQISFWSARDGLLVSSDGRFSARSTVSVTRDRGRGWRVVRVFAGHVTVSAVPGSRTAFAATARGLVRTQDGGETWARISSRLIWEPSFASPRIGWAIGGTRPERERILRTSDGGRTWQQLRGPCVEHTTISVTLASATKAWVVCSFQPGAGQQPKEVWSTNDAGATWRLVNRASPFAKPVGRGLCVCGYTSGITMTPDGSGWLWMARGSFYRTHDGGRIWTSLPISSPELVEGRSATLLTERVGYALFGHRPALRFTRDGGRTWTVVRRWSR